ncbi:MAG: type I 3-dehydroquinate dehydratase [Candidatus Hadarchaeales archaeon]
MLEKEIRLGRHLVKVPAVCGAVAAPSVGEMKKLVEKALADGADIVELRIDFLKKFDGWETLIDPNVPMILTVRPKKEGGNFSGGDAKRVGFFLEGISRGVSAVDIEFRASRELREKVVEKARGAGTSVILSFHDFSGRLSPERLLKIVKEMDGADGDILKVVTMAKGWRETKNALEFLVRTEAELKKPLITFAMGKAGILTRFLGPILGVPIVYAAVAKKTAPGQLGVKETKDLLIQLRPKEVKD